ncbi:MAG: hypothetical protein GSR86_04465 [Desulfurococcales archaeon]|nr:hypothetical protein [Desulfurococcales archaeon]
MAHEDYTRDPGIVKKMASLLMQGAAMLQETCPLDGLPLFRMRNGDIVCPVHGKVVIVSSEAEAREVEVDEVLRALEHSIVLRLRGEDLQDPDRVEKLLRIVKIIEEVKLLRKQQEEHKSGGSGEGPG